MRASAAQKTRRPQRKWQLAPLGPRNCLRSSPNALRCHMCACNATVLRAPIVETVRQGVDRVSACCSDVSPIAGAPAGNLAGLSALVAP